MPEYKKFNLGGNDGLFNVMSSRHIFHANQTTVYDEKVVGSHPYVVRSSLNNGVRGYIVETEMALNDGNTMSFAQDTFCVFYQKEPYFTGNKVKVLSPRFQGFNREKALFIATLLYKGLTMLTWGTGSNVESIEKIKISLPITAEGEIDFAYMESYILEKEAACIREIEAARIRELKAYLKVTGLSDFNLTVDEQRFISNVRGGEG
ncbi:MAG: restriction endonuclease subunit S [Candidatus Methanoplasma sp.]|jgi:hypothetical protein|nr:restriction endonuclease subunit S [Candidatus Methanoplasma sp.]